jgi:hypothetical protein
MDMNRAQQLLKIAAGKVILESIKSEEDAVLAKKFCPGFARDAANNGFGATEIAELAPIVVEMDEWKAETERFLQIYKDEVKAVIRAPRAKWPTCFDAMPSRYR